MGLNNTDTTTESINDYKAREQKSMKNMADMKKAEFALDNAVKWINAHPNDWRERFEELIECGQKMEKLIELNFNISYEKLMNLKLGQKGIRIKPGILKVETRDYIEDYPPATENAKISPEEPFK